MNERPAHSEPSRAADLPGGGPPDASPSASAAAPRNFIEDLIDADIAAGRWGVWPSTEGELAGRPRIHTRFPPEPNGYLHIGHAKSICLNFGLARRYGGKFNLRFDDTNPSKEEQEYVDSIQADVRWIVGDSIGADWKGPHGGGLHFASDHFEQMYRWAEQLVAAGKAYVCDLSADEMSRQRGIPQKPGEPSPHRERPIDENLDLFRRMRQGEFPNGARTLRAKIDMASPNLNLRDPVMYRIVHEAHHNTKDAWCIYPMYDWAHGLEDSIEGITHSICTLEFENHRPLYDWFLRELGIHHPQQIEFARLNLTYTVLSKRRLIALVNDGHVRGWDDPRLPTIAGLRRRGFPAEAIRTFCEEIGVTKTESVIDVTRLENAVRDRLNKIAPRRMAVLDPVRVVIENFPADHVEWVDVVNNPEDPAGGTRRVAFTRELLIERDDFMEDPPKKFFRLGVGREVRLRCAYFVTCTGIVKDPASDRITELRCTYDPATRGGDAPDGRKVKGTLHWVSATNAIDAEVRLVDRLFTTEEPGKTTGDHVDDLNPDALRVVRAKLEPSLAEATIGDRFQFERIGYFCVDADSRPGALVFNRTVTLKDSWGRGVERG